MALAGITASWLAVVPLERRCFGRLEDVVLPLRPELEPERIGYVPLQVEGRGLEAVDRALRAQADLRERPGRRDW